MRVAVVVLAWSGEHCSKNETACYELVRSERGSSNTCEYSRWLPGSVSESSVVLVEDSTIVLTTRWVVEWVAVLTVDPDGKVESVEYGGKDVMKIYHDDLVSKMCQFSVVLLITPTGMINVNHQVAGCSYYV